MNRLIASTAAGLVLFGVMATAAFAGPMAVSAPSTLKCPSCTMTMSLTKTKAMPVPIYVKAYKKVYYCCAGCKSGAKAAAYFKKHHHPMPV
jgi:hypothetical protein